MALVSFGSDNHSGVHPRILQALIAANTGYAPSYGMDEASQKLQSLVREKLGAAEAYLVFNGTAANVLCLSTAVRSFESVICADLSHLNIDECAAPEKFLGGKLIPVPHRNGKLSVDDLPKYFTRRGDQHASQVRAISITQPTEHGTVYTLEELLALRKFCDKEKLYLHIDGARLGNACFALDCDFKDIISFSDVTSLGGTKNGLLFGELVVIQNKELTPHFKFLRKQAMQLPSKTRFMAEQFLAYFADNLWREIANHQCGLAKYLEERLGPFVKANYPVESNAVFCNLPQKAIKELRDEFFFYVWDELTFECRLMTTFVTTHEEVDNFTRKVASLLKERL